MMLWIEFPGFCFRLNCNEDTTILDLKNQLEEKLGIPVGQQDLLYEGQLLQDEKKVLDYQIIPGSKVTCRRLYPINEVRILHRDGRTPPITIQRNTTIHDVKEAAEKLLNIPKEYIELKHGGLSLEDDRLVRSYDDIRDHDDLRLIKKYKIAVIGIDRIYDLLVHGETLVKQVKQMLQQEYGIPAATIRLRLANRKELDDRSKLMDYEITPRLCHVAMDIIEARPP